MLIENSMFGEIDKVKKSIDRLKTFEPSEGYYLAFSGGKDSQCIYHLAKEAGVKFDAHYSLTTVDPPELVYFIRDNYPDVKIDKPKTTMWKLIQHKQMPPTRLVRYCCDKLKEINGKGRVTVTGVRWDESIRRREWKVLTLNAHSKKQIKLMGDNTEDRRLFETCVMKSQHILNPIIEWLDEDVWEYLGIRNIKHCRLYDEGFRRLGCIGCPMGRTQQIEMEFERWPKYKDSYLRAFGKMLIENQKKGVIKVDGWKTPEDVMNWWIYGKGAEQNILDGQLDIMDEVENF